MPVAEKTATKVEADRLFIGQTIPKLIRLDSEIAQEISEKIDKIRQYEEEINEDKRRIERTNDAIKLAHELIAKAESKRESLLRKNQFLKNTLEEAANRTNQALEYWKNYGLDIKEISTNHYEFIYTKLNVSVGIKFDDKQLKVVSQDREVITSDAISELNSKLTNNCVHGDGTKVDYKAAMLAIKLELMKNLPQLDQS